MTFKPVVALAALTALMGVVGAMLAATPAAAQSGPNLVVGEPPQPVLPLLRKQLQPVPDVGAGRLQRLLAELDDDRFEVRERAARAERPR